MEYQRFYDKLLEILKQYYPQKSATLKELAAHLRLDQRNLARRMRGETQFTVEEFVKLCMFLNISFDSLLVQMDQTVHPLKILLRNLATPFIPESFRELLLGMEYTALDREKGHAFFCSNFIPNGLYTHYPELSRYVYYSWSYKRYPGKYKKFDDFRLSEQMADVIAKFGAQSRQVKNSEYLLSNNFIENISEYILFSHEMEMLTPENSLILIEELTHLLDELEQCAQNGKWPATDNRIDIYVTPVVIPNTILITESSYYKAAIIYAFFLNPIINIYPETFVEIKNQAYSMLRHSENISISGEKNRAVFIKNQRNALAKLSHLLKLE